MSITYQINGELDGLFITAKAKDYQEALEIVENFRDNGYYTRIIEHK